MSKLGLLIMPLMAISLLASCGNGGNPEPHPADKNEYLCFTCNSDSGDLGWCGYSSIEEYSPTLEYSTDKKTWVKAEEACSLDQPTLIHHFKKGESLFLRGDNPYGFSKTESIVYYFSTNFSNNDSNTDFSISGNIMSLLGKDNFNNLLTIPTDYCFLYLFEGCDITDASGLCLPATLLSYGCYSGMFHSCSKLTKAPELPAPYLKERCYNSMFEGCTKLIEPPSLLPAEKIPDYSYASMFKGCANLVNTPTLSMKELGEFSCDSMFEGCTNLDSVFISTIELVSVSSCNSMFNNCVNLKEANFILSAEYLPESSYSYMFNGCINLVLPPNILAKTLMQWSCTYMFFDCSNLNVTSDGSSGIKFFESPDLSDKELGEVADDMFAHTKAKTDCWTPKPNTIYYYIPSSN